jgi:SAM-dependent methyltransferase
MAITREGQRSKYETDERYHASADDFDNMYSLRSSTGLYFETRRMSLLFDLLNEHSVPLSGRKVLDVGCHFGFYSSLFAYLKHEADGVTGCDFIDDYLAVARRVNASVRFEQQDMYEPTLPEGGFDLVLVNYLMNCIPEGDATRITSNLAKLVAPGGHVLFFDFHYSPAWRALASVTGRDSNPLPSFNDDRTRALWPELQLLSSRTAIPYGWRRLIQMGVPRIAIDVLEKGSMCQYYGALLERAR